MINRRFLFILLGPLSFLFFYIIGPFDGMSLEAHAILCSTIWIAIWWISEAIPIPITSLLPLVLFPLSGGLDLKSTASAYGDKIIFFYMAGFFIALAMQKWGLHKRIALNIINLIGSNKKKIILGFMISSALLSMWISNTSTSIMMLTIGIALTSQFSLKNTLNQENNFGKALMLGIAYSSSIGGFSTLYGTPPNMILKSNVEQYYNTIIEFNNWFLMAFPLSLTLLTICWYYLVYHAFNLGLGPEISKNQIKSEIKNLGTTKYEEKFVLIIFLFFIFGLIFKQSIQQYFINIDDTIIAIIVSIFLFIIPDKNKKQKLMEWNDAIRLPWGVILLFGAGLSLALAIQVSGLADWIGQKSYYLREYNSFLILFLIVLAVNFLTEITSNLATVSMLLPILASVGSSLGVHPFVLMVSTTVAASCAFMLPVATPPNAIVFGSGYLNMKDMVKTGLFMNVISIILISVYIYYILPLIWDLDLFLY